MKRILLILCCIASMTTIKAQWAVTDAPALAQAKMEFDQLKDQHRTLVQQKDKLDETLNFMKEVNSLLYKLDTVKNLYEREKRLSKQCQDIISNADGLNVNVMSQFTSTMGSILTNSTRIVKMTRTILSKDLKMNDSERLQMLKKMEEELIEEEKKAYTVNNILNQYNIARKMIEKK